MEATDQISLPLSEPFRSALSVLLAAFDYAADSRADRWQFAIDLSDLFARGATLSDIRWLIHRGLAEHAKETTTPGDPKRSFRALAPTSFPADACLTLTDHGATSLRPLLQSREASAPNPPQSGAFPDPRPPTPDPSAAPRPLWDPLHRELRYAGQVIKRYRVPAPNQELILTAFQEEGWPEFIDDPLSPTDGIEPKLRLQRTIKCLNRHQLSGLIRFHGNGNGLRVHWEPVRAK